MPPPPKKCHYPFKPNQWNVQPSFPHKARARVHVWESNNLFSFLSVQPSHPFSPSLWHKRQHLCIENNLRDVSWTPNAGKKKKKTLPSFRSSGYEAPGSRAKTENLKHLTLSRFQTLNSICFSFCLYDPLEWLIWVLAVTSVWMCLGLFSLKKKKIRRLFFVPEWGLSFSPFFLLYTGN